MSSARAVPISQALTASEPLANLARRMAESRGRMATILPQLPEELRPLVRPGPVDDAGWALLAAHSAAAAKLRQLLPLLDLALVEAGWPILKLRVKVVKP